MARSERSAHYSIGELCDEFGVTARALRFYEDEELIAPERRGTSRLYSDRDRARLSWILRGKAGRLQPHRHPRIARPLRRRRPARDPAPVTIERCQRADRRAAPPAARYRRHDRRTRGVSATLVRPAERASTERARTRTMTMPVYTAPVRDTRFILDHVLRDRQLFQPAGLSPTRRPTSIEAILDEGGKFAAEVLAAAQPRRRRAGLQAQRRRLGDHARRASRKPRSNSCAGGWTTLSAPEEFGGQGLPQVLVDRDQRICAVGQPGFEMYQRPDARARSRRCWSRARDEQKAKYLPNMVAGTLDRDDEPDRAALRHRPRPAQDPRRAAMPTAAMRSRAPRSSSRRASTTLPRTSSTWSSPRSPARPTM